MQKKRFLWIPEIKLVILFFINCLIDILNIKKKVCTAVPKKVCTYYRLVAFEFLPNVEHKQHESNETKELFAH